MLVVFLGRNTERILSDAVAAFGEQETLVVARDDDTLDPPTGMATVPVSEFAAYVVPDHKYVIVANGGTSAQLLPVVKRLVEAGASFEAWDLQRDGLSQVW